MTAGVIAGYDRSVPYDEALADRVRAQLDGEPGLTERKMFGGIAWMLAGNMAVGLIGAWGGPRERSRAQLAAKVVVGKLQKEAAQLLASGG